MICTAYENIYSNQPNYITIEKALDRIKTGASRVKVEQIREALDKNKADALKRDLPSICFSGKFGERKDHCIIQHSGYLVLDFDNVDDLGTKAAQICSKDFVAALWVSPRGNGLKCLVKLADGALHRKHFAALKEIFPEVDPSGVNESRVCYESYDPHIYINPDAVPFTKTVSFEKIEAKESLADESAIFERLVKWQTNKGGAFVKGERNIFIYKIAGACCRFGIREDSAVTLILMQWPESDDFKRKEVNATVKSAYRSNSSQCGSAVFEQSRLIDKVTRKEIEIQVDIDPAAPSRDIIYGASVKANAMRIHQYGYEKVTGIGVKEIDSLFKSKRGEITGTTGIGNYGKSAFKKWYEVMRILLYGEKFAAFVPEDNPAEEYYHDYVEILMGRNCTPTTFDGGKNTDNPQDANYSNAYDFIGKHIFYLYPQENAAVLEYILERFLEVIMKEGVDGCKIDPWNQVIHDYKGFGSNASKYLEYSLGTCSRFAQRNNVYFDIIMHPKAMSKSSSGNYECPDIFDMNDGAMWNNKLDNILVYHRPFKQTDGHNPTAEFHSKKIKRQKIVGKPGFITLEYIARTRRFEINGHDYMQDLINLNKLDFHAPIVNYKPKDPPPPDNPQAGIRKAVEFRQLPKERDDPQFFPPNDPIWKQP